MIWRENYKKNNSCLELNIKFTFSTIPRLSAAVRQSAKKLELNPNQLFYLTEYGFLTDNRREQKQLQMLNHDVSGD